MVFISHARTGFKRDVIGVFDTKVSGVPPTAQPLGKPPYKSLVVTVKGCFLSPLGVRALRDRLAKQRANL